MDLFSNIHLAVITTKGSTTLLSVLLLLKGRKRQAKFVLRAVLYKSANLAHTRKDRIRLRKVPETVDNTQVCARRVGVRKKNFDLCDDESQQSVAVVW